MPLERDGRVLSGALNAGLPTRPQTEELFDGLFEGPGIRIERIVSTGQTTPDGEWYDQSRDEFVLLVSGAARLRIDGESRDRELAPGDWLLLPAHCRHRVTWTQAEPPTIWLAVHFDAAPAGAGDKE
ncbi:cupin domain-containing protein [Methyloceanibacter sp. wino2]|uniref:cupin domain-containing protein n=1 Tax=Methyloceanibacter sp. wino2 TaxID=2170729 RepID=UPI001FE03B2A|nr:cupin domain-containing protein [Methyloceanibacter sp. wino2]